MSMKYVEGVKPRTSFVGDKGFTVQAGRQDADINVIVARYLKGGDMARINAKTPFYGDVSEFDGLADCIMKVHQANDLFMDYPAEVRARFDNDPVKFVQFFEDPDNLDEAIDLGLALPRPKVDEPPAEPVVPTPV